MDLRTVTHWNTSCSTIKYVDVYGDSLVLLVQRSNFQTRKRLEAGAVQILKNTGVIGHGHLKFTASSKLEVNYPATSIKEWRLGRVPENTQKATQFGMSVLMVSIRIFFCPVFENSKQEHSQL